jgi:hypothetical protein
VEDGSPLGYQVVREGPIDLRQGFSANVSLSSLFQDLASVEDNCISPCFEWQQWNLSLE